MNGLWVEVEVETIVVEKATIIVPISDPNFKSSDLLIQQATAEATKQIPSVIVNPNCTKLIKANYNQKILRFYPDADGAPNIYCPIEINEMEELLDDTDTIN